MRFLYLYTNITLSACLSNPRSRHSPWGCRRAVVGLINNEGAALTAFAAFSRRSVTALRDWLNSSDSGSLRAALRTLDQSSSVPISNCPACYSGNSPLASSSPFLSPLLLLIRVLLLQPGTRHPFLFLLSFVWFSSLSFTSLTPGTYLPACAFCRNLSPITGYVTPHGAHHPPCRPPRIRSLCPSFTNSPPAR